MGPNHMPTLMGHSSRFTSFASSIPGPDSIQRREYANGMIVLVKENFSSPVVVIDGASRYGAVDVKREQAGLANFMASTLTRGTTRRTFSRFTKRSSRSARRSR